jgi:hypothetical protein
MFEFEFRSRLWNAEHNARSCALSLEILEGMHIVRILSLDAVSRRGSQYGALFTLIREPLAVRGTTVLHNTVLRSIPPLLLAIRLCYERELRLKSQTLLPLNRTNP